MRSQTMSMLRELEGADWFCNVGRPVEGPQGGDVIVASSWDEAVEQCATNDWANFKLEHANRLTMFLSRHHPGRYNAAWNELAREVKAVSEPLVTRKLDAFVAELGLPKAVDDCVRWDVVSACMELEYADLRPPGFYQSLMSWYLRGRFPCGWGDIDENGRFRAASVEPDLDPADPDYMAKAVFWPIYALQAGDQVLPDGRLLIY